jgi:hypothetical protein
VCFGGLTSEYCRNDARELGEDNPPISLAFANTATPGRGAEASTEFLGKIHFTLLADRKYMGRRVTFATRINRIQVLPLCSFQITYISKPQAEQYQSNGDENVQQHFCIAYLCQYCSAEMVIVIVARNGWHLSLEGRSPMEAVSAPKYIPKKERALFAEAMVARNVGKPLAAIFFLRIVIEQFARRQAGLIDAMATGDQIMDAYAGTVPLKYREVMPSLKVWYSNLSGAIHSAKADEELLTKAMNEIECHFKVREAFSIPDAPKAADAK